MWTRAQIKTNAKKALSKNFIYSIGVYIGYLILSLQIIQIYINARDTFAAFSEFSILQETYSIPFIPFSVSAEWILHLGMLFLLVWFGFMLYHIFIVYPLRIGLQRYFIINRHEPARFSELFSVFKTSEYLNIIKISLIMDVKIFLWTLCFIIPGIIKSLEYGMIPNILAENPGIDRKRVFELSKAMTDGEKMEMFWLSLSFFGWILLAVITVIGTFFVDVYMIATDVELYAVLKDKVLNSEIASELDFQS